MQRTGAIGYGTMERSVLDYLGVNAMSAARAELEGLVAWGALRGAAPNGAPWAHLDLSGIRATLTRQGEAAAVLTSRL